MITIIFAAFVAMSSLQALSDWRRGIFLAILIDFLRDPIRKLDPSEPVLITLSVSAVWGCVFIGLWQREREKIREFVGYNATLIKGLQLFVLSIIPGLFLSLLLYNAGYKLVALGAASFLAPFIGIFIGAAFAQAPKDIDKLFRFYAIVNGIGLIGVFFEYANISLPALGGLKNMNWIRYSGEDTIELIAGFYRSPDIMGLHAAHVVMFSLYLASRVKTTSRLLWILLALWGIVCLLLAGRRKMLGIPLVFIGTFLVFSRLRNMRRFAAFTVPLVLLAGVGAFAFALMSEKTVSREYLDYASTLFTDGVQRSNQVIGGSIASTLAEGGFLGQGLGSATQGNYQTTGIKGGWQEDGISRLFRELGVPGVLLLMLSAYYIFQAAASSVRSTRKEDDLAYLQVALLSVVAGNAASFAISHQQYSGDPSSSLLVLIMFGMSLGIGLLFMKYKHRVFPVSSLEDPNKPPPKTLVQNYRY